MRKQKKFLLEVIFFERKDRSKFEAEVEVSAIKWSESNYPVTVRLVNEASKEKEYIEVEVSVIKFSSWNYRVYIYIKNDLIIVCDKLANSSWFVQSTTPFYGKTGKFAQTGWSGAAFVLEEK